MYGSKIVQGNTELTHVGEAFPDGRKIAFAMDSKNMESWRKELGEIASALLLTAHEAAHIAQIRTGDHPPSSFEIIQSLGELLPKNWTRA